MAHWSLDEALALSLGKDPKIVNTTSLAQIQSYSSPFVQEFNKTKELAKRAVTWGKLYDPVLPALFITWAKGLDIPFPEELSKKVLARNKEAQDWKSMYEDLLEASNKSLATANQVIELKNQIISDLENSPPADKPLHRPRLSCR